MEDLLLKIFVAIALGTLLRFIFFALIKKIFKANIKSLYTVITLPLWLYIVWQEFGAVDGDYIYPTVVFFIFVQDWATDLLSSLKSDQKKSKKKEKLNV
jgi:hypothetical protein